MANPKFIAIDPSIFTFTWSEGANSSYPVTNLLNGFSDIYSQSANTDADQWLVIDRGSSLAANTLIVDGHNWSGIADTAIRLQYSTPDDGTWGTPTNIDADISPANNNVFTVEFASVTKRYIRILFNSTVPLTAAPEVGNLYLGTRLEFETTQQWGFGTNTPQFDIVRSRAIDGRLRTAQTYGPIRKHSLNFDQGNSQSDALIASYLTFLETAKGNPFYYIDNTEDIYLVNFERGYNPYEAFRYNQNKIPNLILESTLAG